MRPFHRLLRLVGGELIAGLMVFYISMHAKGQLPFDNGTKKLFAAIFAAKS